MTKPGPNSISDLLEELKTIRATEINAGHRNLPRFEIRGLAEIHPISRRGHQSMPLDVHLRDTSLAGIGFLCGTLLTIDSIWWLMLMQHDQIIGQESVIVRHCRWIGEDLHLIGGQFVVEGGLLMALGVDPRKIAVRQGDENSP